MSLLGAALPRDLNAVEYWEPLPLVECHDEMLRSTGGRWDDWRAFNLEGLAAESLGRLKAQITDILEKQFGDSLLFVLKDPRISRFGHLYRGILKEIEIAPRYIVALRNPLAVMMSLRRRDDMAPGFAGLLWLRHMLDAERATRGQPRVFVSYERLMSDWRPVVTNVGSELGLDWPNPRQTAAPEIDRFLVPALQHHQFTERDLENRSEISPWIRETYKSMRLLEQKPGVLSALATLDSIAADFDRWAPTFGEACFPALAAYESQRDAARSELKATQAILQNETEQSAFHARRSASVEAECETMRRSRQWRIAEGMRKLARRFQYSRKDHR